MRELQVVTAPSGVRFGMFAAGLVNAVTRSGSHRVGGAPLGLLRGLRWTGPDEQGDGAEEFATKELALSLGGPIVSDRAVFFLDLGLERDAFGQTSPATGTDAAGGRDSAVGIRYARAVRFEQILHDQYGVEPGIIVATPNRVPCGNLFRQDHIQAAVNNRSSTF